MEKEKTIAELLVEHAAFFRQLYEKHSGNLGAVQKELPEALKNRHEGSFRKDARIFAAGLFAGTENKELAEKYESLEKAYQKILEKSETLERTIQQMEEKYERAKGIIQTIKQEEIFEVPKKYRGWSVVERIKGGEKTSLYNLVKRVGNKAVAKYVGAWNPEKADKIINSMTLDTSGGAELI